MQNRAPCAPGFFAENHVSSCLLPLRNRYAEQRKEVLAGPRDGKFDGPSLRRPYEHWFRPVKCNAGKQFLRVFRDRRVLVQWNGRGGGGEVPVFRYQNQVVCV